MWRVSSNLLKTKKVVGGPIEHGWLCSRPCTSASKSAKSTEESAASNSSEPPQDRKGSGFFWKLLGLSFVGFGGTVAYAWYDSQFRHKVEDYIPYSKEALSLMLGSTSPSSDADVKSSKPTKSLPVKSLPSTASDSSVKVSTKTSKPEVSVPLPPLPDAPLTVEVSEEEKKKVEKEKVEQAIERRELEETTAHIALETRLKQLLLEASRSVNTAVASSVSAVTAIHDQNRELRRLIDESGNEERSWNANKFFQQDSVWASELDAENAKRTLEKLQNAIKEGKSNAVTHRNSILASMEEELNKLNYSLGDALAQLNKAQSESKIIMEYQNLVRKGREQFRREIDSVVPDVKVFQRLHESQLTEEELNSLIAHAYRRIEQLQQRLASNQEAEQERLNQALQHQREEDDKLAAERLAREREHLAASINVTRQKWEEELRIDLERELRNQLARHAAAHNEHLTEVLNIQKQELQSAFDVFLATRIDEKRAEFQKSIVGWIARMHGIEKALADRADIEKKARRAQELWLACQTLQTVINFGAGDDSEDQLKPLKPELESIQAAASDEDSALLSTIVSAVPDVAVSRGVWTEEALVDRFERVYSVARRVGFVNEGETSLFRFGLSYLWSVFMFRHTAAAAANDEEIAVGNLTPFFLLDRAAQSIEKGDLEQAVRYVNQLSGEPRRVAADWLNEAKLLLETRQAADVLLAYAMAANTKSTA